MISAAIQHLAVLNFNSFKRVSSGRTDKHVTAATMWTQHLDIRIKVETFA
jgi:hypothetical protein